VRKIQGVRQQYQWGDTAAIPAILGVDPDGEPWAEWWLGTHRDGPARLSDRRLLVEESGELPYLLKLLAAAQPLSLQTHPNAQQAKTGFARGQYRDQNAKPELLCALTPFDALCGFRPIAATVSLLRDLDLGELAKTLHDDGLQSTVTRFYCGDIDWQEVIDMCRHHHSPEAELVTQLAAQHPNDPSVVVTLFLNRVVLSPGGALFLEAGNLHAYLSGVGVEVMGASDNVVRGGLTSKPVDVDELLRIVCFDVLEQPVLSPIEGPPGQWRYATPGAPFELWRFDVTDHMTHTATGRELLLCTNGDGGVLHRGDSAYVATDETVEFDGRSTVFVVREQPN
jgi:mannose-6-phosphate isomerase